MKLVLTPLVLGLPYEQGGKINFSVNNNPDVIFGMYLPVRFIMVDTSLNVTTTPASDIGSDFPIINAILAYKGYPLETAFDKAYLSNYGGGTISMPNTVLTLAQATALANRRAIYCECYIPDVRHVGVRGTSKDSGQILSQLYTKPEFGNDFQPSVNVLNFPAAPNVPTLPHQFKS